MGNIKSVKSIGKFQTYDLEIDHPDHQYYLSNGVLTSNSHSILYSIMSYKTAWLKANYPLEFLVSNLMHEAKSNSPASEGNVLKIKEEIRNMGIKLFPPNINKSSETYKIINENSLIMGYDSIKYMNKDSMIELAEKKPFNSFYDLISKVDLGKVTSRSVQALASVGALDSFGMSRKLIYQYGKDYKDKYKAWSRRKVETRGEFNYPWPEDVGEFTIRQKAALENFYIGESLSGTIKEQYPGFFNNGVVDFNDLSKIFPYKFHDEDFKLNRKKNSHAINASNLVPGLKGIVSEIFSWKVKKEDSAIFGQEMAKMVVKDLKDNNINVLMFPDTWESVQKQIRKMAGKKFELQKGFALYFDGMFQHENEYQTSFILNDILDCMVPPELPSKAELKSKTIKMPRAVKAKKVLKNISKKELFRELEDEMLDEGIKSFLDDELD